MDIELTEELMIELSKLKMLSERNFEDFSVAVKLASDKLDLEPNIILKMLYSEEFLHKVVVRKTNIIDREIKEKEAEIVKLKGNKYAYGSLICSLYGHSPVMSESASDNCYCENCGRLVNMSSIKKEHEKGLRNQKVYKRKEYENTKRK